MKVQNYHHYSYRRSHVVAGNMVAASQPLALQTGLIMFHKGRQAYEIIWTYAQWGRCFPSYY